VVPLLDSWLPQKPIRLRFDRAGNSCVRRTKAGLYHAAGNHHAQPARRWNPLDSATPGDDLSGMEPRTPDAAQREDGQTDRLRAPATGNGPAGTEDRLPSPPARIEPEPAAPPAAPADEPRGDIAAYLGRARRYTPLRFVVELGVLSFALKIAMAVLLGMAGILPEGKTNTEMMDSRGGTVSLLVTACLVAPVVETAIGQWLPLWIASLFTRRLAWRVAFSAVAFTAMHLTAGAPTTVAVVPAAVILAWGFAARRETSRWEAYWTTSAIHCIHNAISVFFYFLTK
jgi:hypothetical protein